MATVRGNNTPFNVESPGASVELSTELNQPNIFAIGNLKFKALGDRLILEEDPFRSGYECQRCEGRCKVACDDCHGTQTKDNGKKCSVCSDGFVRCPECGGKGGTLIAPDTAQRRPTSGTVRSVGPSCKELKLGDTVLYSNFAGYVVDLARAGGTITLRILHETEILAQMEGHLTLTNLKGKSEIATFAP